MAALPSPTQVAGSHVAAYEAYYNQADPRGYGRIGALEAARFLKKSRLGDDVLGKIWDMADPRSRGSLDKSGMFVALKLCAFAQSGRQLETADLSLDIPPPDMGDPPGAAQRQAAPTNAPVISCVSGGDWSIKPDERVKYDRLFDSLRPSNGYIPGNKVKGVLMDSKLPVDTLGKIWDLADMDKDGMLDRHEFVVAMHLVYKALEKYAIPSVLPSELMPPGKRRASGAAGASLSSSPPSPPPPPPLTLATSGPAVRISPIPAPVAPDARNIAGLETPLKAVPTSLEWVVGPEDQAAADKLFLQADMDMDGFVSGSEIKDVFLQSRLPQRVLANIWALCDVRQSGKLNKEQFALSMWLIKRKMNGVDPPPSLTPEMMPPSLRKISDALVENNNVTGYSNPELDMISKDIAELARERRAMEQDIAQKEADIKIKNGEIKSLQSELDTLAATLKQLENQRGEAQKRLNDLKARVEKLRQQAEEQESVLRTQEEELNSKRQELEGLRQEEQQLEQQQNRSREQLNELTKNLQDTQLRISQARAKITHLEEQQRRMSDAIAMYDSALATGDPSLVPDTSLQFNPDTEDIDCRDDRDATPIDRVSECGGNGNDAFSNGTEDPFSSQRAKDAFGSSNETDPFGSSSGAFDSITTTSLTATKDPFGEDPFANLHAPTRAESPSPALPPKKAKQPPPRPAPPRPSSNPGGPLRAAPVPPTPSPTPADPFGNANSDPFAAQIPTIDGTNGNIFVNNGTTGFADFANFDSKPEPPPSSRASSAPSRPMTGVGRVATKLPDFTEDPFRDYRYEDPFDIADPFAEEGAPTEDPMAEPTAPNPNNDNGNNTDTGGGRVGRLDPFGIEGTNRGRRNDDNGNIGENERDEDTFDRGGFASDYFRTVGGAPTSRGTAASGTANAFGEATRDTRNDRRVSDTFVPDSSSTTTANFDEAFAKKSGKKAGLDLAQAFKDKLSVGDAMKNRTNAWKNMSSGGVAINASRMEERQLAWASEQSLRTEDERRAIKEREEADLALALKLSKRDKHGKF